MAQPGSFSVYLAGKSYASMTPPVTTMAAIMSFMRPMLMSMAGMALSQLEMNTPPSKVVALACASTRLVMASRWASE